jgi:hypothetical protein
VDEEWDMFKFEVADAIARERSTATVLPVVDTIVDPDAIMQGLDHIRSHDWSTIWSAALKYGIVEPIEAFVTMGYGEAEWEAGILMTVSTFYSGDSEGNLFELAGLCAAIIMGAIHCVAWSLQFPSHVEQLFWRIASFSITCLPAASFLTGQIALIQWGGVPVRQLVPSLLYILANGIVTAACVQYFLSRVALLVIAFTSLRSLPAGAYETVEWTTFIPHI